MRFAVAMLIGLGLVSVFVNGYGVLNVWEFVAVGLLGSILMLLNLRAPRLAEQQALGEMPDGFLERWQRQSRWLARGYIALQLTVGVFILLLALPARAFGLWMIVLPAVARSVLMLSRTGVFITSAACTLILSFNWLGMYGPRNVLEAGASFLFAVLFTVLFTHVAVSAERSRGQVEKLAAELREANGKLREYAVQAEELAINKERNRLAREVHDTLGHYLAVVHVQIDAARTVFGKDGESALRALEKAQALTQDGLREIRRSVAALRASPLDNKTLSEAIGLLADENRAMGLAVHFVIAGEPRVLSPQAELTLYRAAQEGFTNVRKHANATRVDILLDYSPKAKTVLKVQDNGAGASMTASGGFGIMGIRERVQLLGAKMDVETAPGQGFLLALEISE